MVNHSKQQTAPKPQKRKALRGQGCLVTGLIVLLLLLLTGVGLFAAGVIEQALMAPYANKIYPNVYVLGENLGDLTPNQAEERLGASFSDYAPGELILSDGEQSWEVPWSEAGLHLDTKATVQQAFAAGRDQDWRALLDIWMDKRYNVQPAFTLDAKATRQTLERLAPKMYQPPVEATLKLDNDRVTALPGVPGRTLDVDATLEKIVTTVNHMGPDNAFAPSFLPVPPNIADVSSVRDEAEAMLNREIHIKAFGESEGESYTWDWRLDRETIIAWLQVEKTKENPGYTVKIDEEAVRATLADLAAEPEADDWGFPLDKATADVLQTFEANGGEVVIELTPPPRIYVIQPGDTLTIIANKFGMPPGLIAEVNPDTDLDHLHVDQELIIPHQEALTPYDPALGKKIVISIDEQRLRAYENDQVLYDWPCSTGIKTSPTYRGHFQVLDKEEEAYASQWDLWMPHFIAIYRAGGDTYNGIHGLPMLSSGRRLWEGNLGSRTSYGCIILGLEEAKTLYNWADIGVLVTIE